MVDNLELRLNKKCIESEVESNNIVEELKWGLPMKDLYRFALKFYKDKSGIFHISYEDNLKLVAFTQQTIHGPASLSSVSPLGVLDVIGKDRRLAWQQLGQLSKVQSMEGFISLLDRLCPLFKPYVEAIKKDKEEKLRVANEEEIKQKVIMEEQKIKMEEQKKIEDERNREELQKRHLQDALNQQTYFQFKAYSEKQFPGNPDQQAILIRQLQNEHYHQYMQQLQAQVTGQEKDACIEENKDYDKHQNENDDDEREQCESDNESGEYSNSLSPANMWTRPDLKIFKQEVSAGKGDGVIKVGHGDVVTVRVPTHEGGNCLFWEFATDNYDIGFGVYFEWGKSLTTDVSVHISESDDEEEEDNVEEDEEIITTDDLESGPLQTTIQQSYRNRPPLSIIVPVYRRECQNEVYAGKHQYPGEGVYLLKFDNSFSLWRSKTLYYRVFYTR